MGSPSTVPLFFLSRQRKRTRLKCARSQVEVIVRPDLRVWDKVSTALNWVDWESVGRFQVHQSRSRAFYNGEVKHQLFRSRTVDRWQTYRCYCYAWTSCAQMFNIVVSKEPLSRLPLHSQRWKCNKSCQIRHKTCYIFLIIFMLPFTVNLFTSDR